MNTTAVTITGYTASADYYPAVLAVVAVIISALCVIWGFKQVLRLLDDIPEV